jgi:23S rRNA (guanosine2251-2'-O)-methyltransferase
VKNSVDIIYGIHAVQAALEHAPESITALIVQAERHDQKIAQILNQANAAAIRIQYLSAAELNKRYPQINHQGVIAQCKTQKSFNEQDLENILDEITGTPLLLILDGVQDPHNLGACLRTANAAGVHAVIAPKDRAASLTPTVRKVASGATETTPFISVTNLARTLRLLKDRGIWLFGLAGEATSSLYSVDLRVPAALVLGAEGEGMRRLTREHCDQLLLIPMAGAVSSLNVSVAAGVCLYEVVRQRINVK